MKKLLTATTLSTALIVSATADAQSAATDAKKAAVFGSSAVAGAVVGGPIGFIAGALGGVWLGEKVGDADRLETELTETQAMLQATQTHLDDKEQQLLAATMVAQLKLDLMFTTGSDELEAHNNEVVAQLADFLIAQRDLVVRIDGHADARGEFDDNLALSKQRSTAVRDQLIMLGVEPVRIQTFAHGASYADGNQVTTDELALDRRVSIQIAPSSQNFAVR